MAVTLNLLSTFDAKGLDKAQKEMEKLAGKSKTSFANISKQAAVAGAAVAAAGAAIGVGLFKVGQSFDQAYDTIRIGTGATGDALEGLKNDMRAVAATVPSDFGSIGTAIADINTRLGLTGVPLQQFASQMLNLSRITGTDLNANITATTRVMGDWGISMENAGNAADLLFRASQATGPSVDELSQLLVQFGAPLRQLGFSFEQSAALVGKFQREGVNTELVLGSLRVALGRMAKAGEDPVETLQRVTDEIKNAGSAGEANAMALDVFGARAGPDMAAAIREGRFELGSLLDTVANGTETINGASADTASFSEQFQLFKNRALLAIEPIATRVFDSIGNAIEWLTPKVEQLASWMEKNGDTVKIAAGIIGGIAVVAVLAYAAAMASAAVSTIIAMAPILAVVAVVAALVAGFIWAYNNVEWFRDAMQKAWEVIQAAVQFAWENIIKPIWEAIVFYVTNILIPYLTFLWGVFQTAFRIISDAVSWAWNNVIKPIWDAIYWAITNILIPYITFLWNTFVTAFDIIKGAIEFAWNNVIKPIWDAIVWYIENFMVPMFNLIWNTVQTVFGFVVSIIENAWAGIQIAFDAIKGGIQFLIDAFNTIKDSLSTAFNAVFDVITWPFRTAFEWIAKAWNNTVGNLSFTIPSWIPGIGGNTFSVPKLPETVPFFKDGGIFRAGTLGGAGLAVLHDREMVLNDEQQRALFQGRGGMGGATYQVNVSVAPTADQASVGKAVVEAIAAFERRSGRGWRAA